MRGLRFTDDRVIKVLEELPLGSSVFALCAEHGACERTLPTWRSYYDGIAPCQLRRVRGLEARPASLERELSRVRGKVTCLRRPMPNTRKNAEQCRAHARNLMDEHDMAERRACALAGISRSSARYEAVPGRYTEARGGLRRLGFKHMVHGCGRLRALPVKDERFVSLSEKVVERLYSEEGLGVLRKRGKKRSTMDRVPTAVPADTNVALAMDFVADLVGGRNCRMLVVIDAFRPGCVATFAGYSLRGERGAEVLDPTVSEGGGPEVLKAGNRPEFTGTELAGWVRKHGVRLSFGGPSPPTDTPHVESFNSRFRNECLSYHEFASLVDLRETVECWRIEYNTEWSHSSSGYRFPTEFARDALTKRSGRVEEDVGIFFEVEEESGYDDRPPRGRASRRGNVGAILNGSENGEVSGFDTDHVNVSDNLLNLCPPDEAWKVHLIEETFYQTVWDTEG